MDNKKLILEVCSDLEYIDVNLMESYLQEMKNLSDSDLDKASTVVKKNMKSVEKYLKDHHVDISFLKKQAKKMEQYAIKAYKRGEKPDQAALKAVKTIGKETIKKSIAGAKKYYDAATFNEALIGSLGIFTLVVLVNTFFFNIFAIGGIITGMTKLAEVLIYIITGPLVEETAKRYAIEQEYPFIYTTIFAGLEGVLYVARMVAAGINLPLAVAIRVVGIIFHFSTLLVQMYYKKKAINTGDESYDMIGFMVAFFMHATWNAACIMPTLLS